MQNASGEVLYVGKAKNLKKRVSSYFHRQLDTKTQQLVKQIHSIEVTVTRNEREALLLESNLIKQLKPRYNILFKDDKSYPYLWLSKEASFPRLGFHRGEKTEKGHYFGPYPSSRTAREALSLLQGIFRLRQCDDVFFQNRSRPCLQYQIKRCTAPCVGFISKEEYQTDVLHAKLFLEGKNQTVIQMLIDRMEEASQHLQYEVAARVRDQIARLRGIQEQQIIMNTKGDVDVLGIAHGRGEACIQVLVVRDGNILGTRQYFPDISKMVLNEQNKVQEWLKAFIVQHYVLHPERDEIPKELIVPVELQDKKILEDLLSEKKEVSVKIIQARRGDRLKWLQMATESAKHAYESRIKAEAYLLHRFEALQEALQLEAIPERLECFDVSHSLGEATIASCVVFDIHGPVKPSYRRFNIKTKTAGDDYAALTEGLTRRYTRLKSEGKILPDILIIDGGKGQVNSARAVLTELQVTGVTLLGIAKGPTRKPGLETLYLSLNGQLKELKAQNLGDPALHLVQQLRDEAHRFAIEAHRKQRAKRRIRSILEDIPGIGNMRRLNLLRQFGGLQEVKEASQEELAKVPGISLTLAQKIYKALHGS